MKEKLGAFFSKLKKTLDREKIQTLFKSVGGHLRDAVVCQTKTPFGIAKLALLGLMLVCLVLLCVMNRDVVKLREAQNEAAQTVSVQATAKPAEKPEEEPEEAAATVQPLPTAEPAVRITPPPPGTTTLPDYMPAGDAARITATYIEDNGLPVTAYEATEDYQIDFGGADSYAASVEGITTYRGNNFRDTAQYGTAPISEERFGDYWLMQTSSRQTAEGKRLSGTGWTGQPLVVRWPEELRDAMDLFEWAQEKDGLTEVIVPSQDGHIYFLDLETGSRTREAIDLGMSVCGTATLDPRGWPILYVGGGATNEKGESPCVMIVDLIEGEVVYRFGSQDNFAVHWNAGFDAAPLVDAESDQLIVTGKNGVLYLMKLNASYDAEEGEVTVEPSRLVKWKYSSESADAHAYGTTASPLVWRGHLITADRGGDLFCVDLNTLTVDWCIDGVDCAMCTPILEVDGAGHPYLYMAPAFEYGFRAYYQAEVPIWKIDAETGEILWQKEYSCFTDEDVAGGVVGGFALGRGECDGMLYVEIARTPGEQSGLLVALDCMTGEELWRCESHYSVTVPTFVLAESGKGYLLHVTRDDGSLCLLNAKSGAVLDQYNFGVCMESAPVVFDDMLIVGTERYSLFGIRFL